MRGAARTATKPDLALTLGKKLANSNPNQIEELVHWLIEFEPENSIELLVVISESIDFDVAPILEAMVE
ncbi:hypothetical protein [Vibrio fortis]|uniref:hypothetical protein n=1 Tax=Vibrio fortis TaxID=212667 RepID=UPI0038CD7DB6